MGSVPQRHSTYHHHHHYHHYHYHYHLPCSGNWPSFSLSAKARFSPSAHLEISNPNPPIYSYNPSEMSFFWRIQRVSLFLAFYSFKRRCPVARYGRQNEAVCAARRVVRGKQMWHFTAQSVRRAQSPQAGDPRAC